MLMLRLTYTFDSRTRSCTYCSRFIKNTERGACCAVMVVFAFYNR